MSLTCKCCGEVICKFEAAARDDSWRDRALKAEAELARVTAEAAVMREALNHIATYPCHRPHCPCCHEDMTYAKDALSSTGARAGLLKRLEASEAVCAHAERLQDGHGFTPLLEAWKRARGETT